MRSLFVALVFTFSSSVFAQTGFNNVDSSDFEAIIEDFSALLAHTSVSGANSLGDVFGFEVGIIGGISDTPGVERLSKEVDSTSDVSQLPHAGILVAVSFPMGFTGELNFLPEIEAEDADLSKQSLAVKWTFSKFLDWPVDVAAKVAHSANEFSFTQDSPAPGTLVTYESTIQSLGLVASKNFVLFEPYAGFNLIKADGEMSANNAIYSDSSTSSSKDLSGTEIMAGVNLNLLVLKLGFEASKIFDATKMSAKLSFYF